MTDEETPITMTGEDLVIGIDGGGSTTVAWLALADGAPDSPPLGHGQSGASNPQSVGWDVLKENLWRAVEAAFQDAGRRPCQVNSMCVALAGGDREHPQREIVRWAQHRRLAERIHVVNDALPVLAAATVDGVGVCLIAGTGSLAFGRAADGQTARAGGWGYLLGDEGSSYAISVAALQLVARSLDGRSERTSLCDLLLEALGVSDPSELIPTIYPRCGDRAWIASLARVVFAAADLGDTAARSVVSDAGAQLAILAATVADKLQMNEKNYALALAGGALVHNPLMRESLMKGLAQRARNPGTCKVVAAPVAGAVRLARRS